MKRTHLIAGLIFLFSLSSTAFAITSTGHLFRVEVPAGFTGINGLPLTIYTTIPKQTYTSAGIQMQPGVTISGCTPSGNRYCLFRVSDTQPAVLTIMLPTLNTIPGPLSVRLCLNGVEDRMSCENHSIFKGPI